MVEIYRCDEGKENYSQRNNEVNPHNTCQSTAMIQAGDYLDIQFPKIFPEFKQPEDKFTMFTLTNPEVAKYYEKVDKKCYDEWVKERDTIKKMYPNKSLKDYRWESYPPAEYHAVLNYAFNLFVGKKCTELKMLTVSEIVEELKKLKPVVVSVKFGSLNHVITLVGVMIVDGKPTEYYVDDTYGRFSFETNKYSAESGNDMTFKASEFEACLKPKDSAKKIAHVFM